VTIDFHYGKRALPAPICPQHCQSGTLKEARKHMAKSQKRSNREIRKPKAAKVKPGIPAPVELPFPVSALVHKSKGKL